MLIVLMIIAIITAFTIFFFSRADFHGKIGDLEESKFVLYPIKIDPEAD